MQKKDSLEFKILLKVTINIGIMSVLATIANLITGLYFLSIITSSASILYFVIYYLLKSKPFITIHNTFVIITFYIYCILLWFFNGGTFGITLLLLFILYFICSFIIQLKNQTVFFIGSLAIILTLIITEFYFPKLIPQVYIERFDRYLDISIGSLISLLMVKLLVNIIKSNYNDERRLVQKRNEELETSRSDLRESKDFFNKLVENLPGVSYQFCMQLNGEIKFNFISGAVESIYRVSAEQVYADGHILFKMITDDTILQFNNELNNSFRNISYFNNEHKIITPNGNKKHILTLAKPEKQEDGSVIWYGYNKDITDRKIEAENVIASENKFRFISENTSDGIIVLEKTGITYTSDSYLKMVGYTKEKIFARTEEQILSFIHPNDCDGLLNAVELANQEKLPNLTYSYRYLHKDGHYFWREDTFSFFYNELGENYKDIIVVRNIDGQRRNRLELEQAKSMLDQTSNIAKVGGWEVDMATKQVIWTDLIYEMYELNQAEFTPTILSILRYFKKGKSRNIIAEFFTQAKTEGKEYDEELELFTEKGNLKWVRAIGKTLIQNGICVKVYGTLQDITKQKELDFKLKELALVASKTSDAVIITDAKAKITWVNKAFENMTEYSLEEVVGKEQKDLLSGPNTNLGILNGMIKTSLNFEPIKATILNYTKSGKPIWFDVSATPVFDENGICTNFIDVKKDVTERMEKQEQLQALTDVTADQNKRLLNFTYIVSHNIRSHSANLTGLINLIDNTEEEDEKATLFKMLKTSTNKLEETIQNLNEIISVQNNINQAKAVLNLKNEIERTFLVVNDVILESEVSITNLVSDELNIEAIPAYLDSILLNLITNAIKYRSPNRTPIIEISTEIDGDYLVLLVKDNGLGLDLVKYKDKLFGMYKTFHNNPNSRGIGLFITKNQIEAMNGKIEVESKVNEGTTFKIYFPKMKP